MSDKPSFSVLFVCTGNTCRSPMAEALMRARIPAEMASSIRVSSAGVMAGPGAAASALTVRVLETRGIDASGHRSRRLTREMAREADVILALEPEHRHGVLEIEPAAREKTFVLSEFAWDGPRGEQLGVHDPVGGSLEIYEETCRRIEIHLDRALPEILDRLGAK